MKKKKEGVLEVVRKELADERNEKIVLYTLMSITLASVSILIIFFASHLLTTGYDTYVLSQPGSVTELQVNVTTPTQYWAGIYGLALSVNNFTQQLTTTVGSSNITRQDLFFSCLPEGTPGGDIVFASTSPSINFNNISAGSPSQVDAFTGCNASIYNPALGANHVDCAANTFTGNSTFVVENHNVTNVPSTYTYQYTGQNNLFDLGLLTDGQHLIYATNIQNIQQGFDPQYTVNYQMLLPTNPNNLSTYYFFTDPSYTCPTGTFGLTINGTVYGYVTDTNGNPIQGTTVSLAGYTNTSASNGLYNVSFSAGTGVHNVFITAPGYDPAFENVTINTSSYNVELNATLEPYSPGLNQTIKPVVSGYVTDISGNPISGAQVFMGNTNATSDSNGFYSVSPVLPVGQNPIAAIAQGYENYYAPLDFTAQTTNMTYNINMTTASLSYPFQTGPYTQPPKPPVQPGGISYWVSTKEIDVQVRQNTFMQQTISLYDFNTTPLNVIFSMPSDVSDFMQLSQNSVSVSPSSYSGVQLIIYGTRPIGDYNTTITLSGDVSTQIPVHVQIVPNNFPIQTLLSQINVVNPTVNPGGNLTYKLSLQNLMSSNSYQVLVNATIKNANGTVVASQQNTVEIANSLTQINSINIPAGTPVGSYTLDVNLQYLSFITDVTAPIQIQKPLYLYAFFGIPLWIYFTVISAISFIFLNSFLYRVYKKKKARYGITMDYATLPGPGERTVKLGLIAETKRPAYYEIDKLTTHAIIAGATGMGKSISAQVVIEEALLQNVAVLVFDPTAQWSGMLRKCTDKKMLEFYPKFGLKESDARGFKGNVREIKDAREYVDVKKYMNPGQIQILTLNKLQPKDIDVFVANVIRGIFESDPKESPNLKLLLVFDEVHRLLSKFGGSGQGFLQVERACREFRKWGMGVMLISQVLADFVGEIKANINTELQTRTVEEGDLDRIKTKYGEEYLKSLVRAEVGVVMFQNAEYNRGKPYFINMRPILHNTRRLSDEELEKYNQYNDQLDDLEDQIAQLETEKVDTFDFKMEIKLMKDKLMTGNFSVVEIYMEGLKPRIEKEWQRLGKKPKPRQLKLVSQEDIQKSIEEAQKSRSAFEQQEAAKQKQAPQKQEEKKEDLDTKLVQPLTFDNGIMISTLKELKDVLPNLDDDIFKTHVNDQKNDIAKWISDNFSDNSLAGIKTKPEMIKALQNVGKSKSPKAAPAKAAGVARSGNTKSGKSPAKK